MVQILICLHGGERLLFCRLDDDKKRDFRVV